MSLALGCYLLGTFRKQSYNESFNGLRTPWNFLTGRTKKWLSSKVLEPVYLASHPGSAAG